MQAAASVNQSRRDAKIFSCEVFGHISAVLVSTSGSRFDIQLLFKLRKELENNNVTLKPIYITTIIISFGKN